jgi:hypothetical protein
VLRGHPDIGSGAGKWQFLVFQAVLNRLHILSFSQLFLRPKTYFQFPIPGAWRIYE